MRGHAAGTPLKKKKKKIRESLHLSAAGIQAYSLRKEAVPFGVISKVPSELKIL